MTKTNLLEKRKQALAQKKNRLKKIEVSLNAHERKRRTRQLIEIGGLVAKAKLEEWDTNTLYGALLSLKDKASDKSQIDAWTTRGGAAFSTEKDQNSSKGKRNAQGIPVIVKFESKPDEQTRQTLKSIGLKWNSLRGEWEGYAIIQEIKSLLGEHRAVIMEIKEF